MAEDPLPITTSVLEGPSSKPTFVPQAEKPNTTPSIKTNASIAFLKILAFIVLDFI